MALEQLSFGVTAISGAPVQNVDQIRYKAAWLERLADEIDMLKQNETVVSSGNKEKE